MGTTRRTPPPGALITITGRLPGVKGVPDFLGGEENQIHLHGTDRPSPDAAFVNAQIASVLECSRRMPLASRQEIVDFAQEKLEHCFSSWKQREKKRFNGEMRVLMEEYEKQ